MPSRISLPKLSLFSSRDSSSPLQTGSRMPAPTVPPTNITQRASTASPPARLHLRNILPASPEEPLIMPPPPRTPKAWVWQCHQCHSVYRLGCTRRCLDCSHTYCVVSSKQQQQQQSSSNKSRKRRRQQQTALCGAEFDYVGWEQWGSWKRKVLGYESTGRCDATARDRAFLAKSHNCWIDCDSPSECGHRRYELAAEMLRHRMFVPPPPVVADASPKSPDDDIPLTEALVMSEATTSAGDEEGPLKSPLKSSFLLDDDDGGEMEKTREQEEEEEERWWAARSSSEQVDDEDDDEDDGGGGGVKTLTVRNLTASDIAEDSDSDPDSGSESGESGWSTASSVTDDTCCLEEAGTAIKGF
ncbi:hypothetical protein EV127DRAFT_207554 [Xylaria flabelliformis]|nr:hypothetical protein EV127DRAFT_207554 [Xylaria flabelliformis]